MTQLLFTNNAASTLAAGITSTSTTAVLATGTGSLFPNPGAGQGFKLTLSSASGGSGSEIVLVTEISGDTITAMTRAQEGTAAQAWAANDNARHLLTADTLASFGQSAAGSTFALDTGTANVLVAALTVAPSSLGDLVGVPLFIQKGAAANSSGAVTLAINELAATTVTHADGSALGTTPSGEWTAHGIGLVVLNAAATEFQLVSVFSLPALVNEFTSSFGGAGGWIKRPDGVIEQFGTGTTSSGSGTVVFPIAFPNAAEAASGIIGVTGNSPAAPNSVYFDPASVTTTGMNVFSSTGTNIGYSYRILGK